MRSGSGAWDIFVSGLAREVLHDDFLNYDRNVRAIGESAKNDSMSL